MIEIKQSRKLHDSGYRLMNITNNGKIVSKCADVLHIGLNDWLDGLHLDITKDGTIRMWSNRQEINTISKSPTISDAIVMLGKEIK